MTPNRPDLQLVCTDFDGTIHREQDRPPICEAFQSAIATLQGRGAKWVINTGRDLASLMEELARSQLHVHPDYAIVVEREIYRREQSTYVSVRDWNDRCDAVHAELFERIRADVPKIYDWVNERFTATVYEDPWSPFSFVGEHPDHAVQVVAYLEECFAHEPELAVMSNDVYVRLSHVDFNKGTALKKLASDLGMTREQILVAGDHLNDLPMLRAELARWVVAPSNAVPQVVQAVQREGGWLMERPASHGLSDALDRLG